MRRRVVEAEDLARNMREVFADRPVEYEERLPFVWPARLQNVGDSLAAAYGSDKWKSRGFKGRREVELYKHLAESRNRALVRPRLLFDYFSSHELPTIGPMVSLEGLPLPRHFAVLGELIEVNLQLHVAGDDEAPEFGTGDDGIVSVSVARGQLGASKILWSQESDRPDQPFIFVYTPDGVQMMIFGDELDIERDGIVG